MKIFVVLMLLAWCVVSGHFVLKFVPFLINKLIGLSLAVLLGAVVATLAGYIPDHGVSLIWTSLIMCLVFITTKLIQIRLVQQKQTYP